MQDVERARVYEIFNEVTRKNIEKPFKKQLAKELVDACG